MLFVNNGHVNNTGNNQSDKSEKRVIDLRDLDTEEIIIMNELAEEIRLPFNQLIEDICDGRGQDIDWIVSCLASRSIYVSSLFYNCCYLALVKKTLDSRVGPVEIRTNTAGMKRVLDDYLKDIRPDVKSVYTCSIGERIKNTFRPFIRFFYWLIKFSYEYTVIRIQNNKDEYREGIILLDLFVLGNSFQGSEFIDRYYPGLCDFLNPDEREFVYYLPEFYQVRNVGRLVKSMLARTTKFLLKQQFLKPADYRYALLHSWRIKKWKFTNNYFLGFNLKPLVEEDLKKNSVNGSSMLALLNYRFAMRLHERGIKVRLLIDWFENQLPDRGLDFGFRCFHPQTKVVGYQGYVASRLLHMKISELEYNCGCVPDEIAVSGPALRSEATEFCQDLKVIVAPAFRFGHLWHSDCHSQEVDYFSILIALPIGLDEGNEILTLVSSIRKHINLDGISFRVKPHPTTNVEAVKARFGKPWPDEFETVGGDFSEWINRSHLLISNGSSVCLETLAKGIPVIIIGSQTGLTQNPIPASIDNNMWRVVYTAPMLREAVLHFRDRDSTVKESYRAKGTEITRRYFEPVTRESVRRFLKLDSEKK